VAGEPGDVLDQVCARARARAGRVSQATLGPLAVRDFCRYGAASGDPRYPAAARADEAQGHPVLSPALFVTGMLGWDDGPATEDLRPDGLARADSPCTDGLPVDQVHGGQDVEITRLPAAGSLLHAGRAIEGADRKQGRSGAFAVLRLVTTFRDECDATLITSRESIIIRPQALRLPEPDAAPPPALGGRAPCVMTWTPSHVQLFRFSAVSWNAHRIHYDQAFARRAGFPDVLVQSTLHGELLARAALAAAGDGARLRRIAWRNQHPAFAGQTLRYAVTSPVPHDGRDGAARRLAVAATDPCGNVCASADVTVTAAAGTR